ncbi:MAG TPA: AMP-binding protein [Candidatus Dormibacteraeota bacterium]
MTQITHLGYITDDAVRLHGERLAVIEDGLSLTYLELDARANRVAGHLQARGVRPGQRVALLWPNEATYVEAVLGTMRSGAVAVPLNVKLGDEALKYVLQDSAAVALLAAPSALERAETLAGAGAFVSGPSDWAGLSPAFPRLPFDPDQVCFQPYTSGSTGRPKGVLLGHRGQLWCADVVRKWEMIDETDRALVSAPLYHKNAGVTLKVFLIAGGSVVILPQFDVEETLRNIERHRCTYFGGVPAMFRLLLAHPGLDRYDLSSLRFATIGSADVPADLVEEFEGRFGIPLMNGYGLTEGGPDVFVSPRFGIRKPSSLGPPLPGCEARIVSREDQAVEVPVGEVGELWVRNPGVALGYHNLPELTRERIRDGWLATGDLVRRDEDDYHYFLGRKDDLLNVGGENVYPKEVEAILLENELVRDCAVVGVPHPVKGTVPVAAVVTSQPGMLDEVTLKQYFFEHGPAYAHPRRILFLTALPLGSTGKLDRQQVAALFAGPGSEDGGGADDEGSPGPDGPDEQSRDRRSTGNA